MECKLEENGMSLINEFELIDTLWNVNTMIEQMRRLATYELIDTLWNVNVGQPGTDFLRKKN